MPISLEPFLPYAQNRWTIPLFLALVLPPRSWAIEPAPRHEFAAPAAQTAADEDFSRAASRSSSSFPSNSSASMTELSM